MSGTIGALDLSTEDAWACTLHSLVRCDPNFFSSQEATLQTQTVVGQGRPAYKSVPVSEKNNDDLAEIFHLEYEPKIAGGGKNGSWKQVCMAAGQLLRLAVMCQKVEVESMWESGVLFTTICDRSTVELLVSHYRIRTVCTTVMTKVFCLKKVAEHAKIYFEGRDAILGADAERSRIHLRAIYNVQKALGRQRTTDRQVIDDRVERAALFLPDDFRRCKQRIRKSLDDIMTSFDDFRADVGEDSATETMFADGRLKNKWCINIINVLVLTGGGQRPQVYTQLQVPSDSDLVDMSEMARVKGFLELRTVREKTRRSLAMPYVLFPGYILPYIKFHCAVVRPQILKAARLDESDMSNKPLIVHSESGVELRSPQITKTFKRFLSVSEPTLVDCTVMTLRSSYGTMMMKSFREKKIFPTLTEAAFLDIMAQQMNTSAEQLRSTYVGIDHTDYVDTARSLVGALAVATGAADVEDHAKKGDDHDISGFFA